jgi:hypothetical protein
VLILVMRSVFVWETCGAGANIAKLLCCWKDVMLLCVLRVGALCDLWRQMLQCSHSPRPCSRGLELVHLQQSKSQTP